MDAARGSWARGIVVRDVDRDTGMLAYTFWYKLLIADVSREDLYITSRKTVLCM